MSEEKSLIDILCDAEDSENIVLQAEDGAEIEFEQIATIPFQDDLYCILRPVTEEGPLDEDEAIVFQVVGDDNDEYSLSLVEDEGLGQLIFEEYYKACDLDDEE